MAMVVEQETANEPVAMAPRVFTFQDTTATKRVFNMDCRIRAVTGGTSASKTISILVWLIDYCQSPVNANKLASVVSQTYNHLEKGAMLDFELIMKDRGYWDKANWNQSRHTYTFPFTGAKLEFFAIDTELKGRGPRRDVLFVNEANSIAYKIFDQLRIRTREVIWMDWNPSEEFWFYEQLLPFEKNLEFITLTYLDNEALDPVTVADIEAHRHNKAWWRVYGLGLLGEVEGRIYTNWLRINDVPHEARMVRRGLDFGFTNDPAALLDIYQLNGGYIFDERLYAPGMTNPSLAQFILNIEQPRMLVSADSSEPKSIQEMANLGVNIIGAAKGPGSVNFGIKHIQDQQISYTSRSYNLEREYKRYFWMTDKDGNIIKTPMDEWNHLLDAARYGMETLGQKETKPERYVAPPSSTLIY